MSMAATAAAGAATVGQAPYGKWVVKIANDVRWIKLKVGMFDGESFRKIKRAKIGGEKFRDKLTAIWFELMDFAGKCNHAGAFINSREIPYTSLDDIATMIDRETDELELCMSFYLNEGMVEIIDDVYKLTNWAEYQNEAGLEKIREQRRLAQARWRAKQKALEAGEAPEPDVDVVDGDVDSTEHLPSYSYSNSLSTSLRDKEGGCGGKQKAPKTPTKAEIDAFFEEIWKLYPVKKGKASVSDSKKKTLFAIGVDEIKRAIDRYLSELKKDESWRKAQNGSTFFNSGYVDYLDKNFVPDADVGSGKGSGTIDYGKPEDFYN